MRRSFRGTGQRACRLRRKLTRRVGCMLTVAWLASAAAASLAHERSLAFLKANLA